MKRWLTFRLDELKAVMLGIALAFAFAPFELFPLAIIAPAGLLALILPASPKRAFWLGFCFGVGLFGAGVYWIYISVHNYGEVPYLLATLITAGLVGILALFPSTTCYFTTRYFPVNNLAKCIYAFPAIWLTIDWIRSWIGCGFAWLFLGYSQTNSPLRGYAPILSIYGVSLAVLISSGLAVHAYQQFKQNQFQRMYLNLVAFVSIWILGALLSLIPWTSISGKPLTVSLIQGNIPQSMKWSPEHVNLSFERYETLTNALWGKSDLIVWPEAAIPVSLQNAAEFIQHLDDKAIAHHAQLILGIPIQSPTGDTFYNAIVTLGKSKRTYVKRRLVPYGEYVPFQRFSSHILNFMNVPMANMEPGKSIQPPLLVGDVKINASICFEITFPELINTRDRNIGMLLTVTNDAWFGQSTAQAQHLQMAQMRAIELGRPVLFASNDGITAIINAQGQIIEAAPAHVPYVLTSKVQPMVGLTPWMTNGMDPLLVIIVCLLIAAKRSTYRSNISAEAALLSKN